MDIADERGALLSLAQHHGFPTPLLDWTQSPYVAAWFAFEKARQQGRNLDEPVRVFLLNKAALLEHEPSSLMTNTYPHISTLETLAIQNPRILPQQGVTTLTTVLDVESHLLDAGKKGEKLLIDAFDIPYFERDKVLSELKLMGITRGTLFPGLDGICSDLKSKRFPEPYAK